VLQNIKGEANFILYEREKDARGKVKVYVKDETDATSKRKRTVLKKRGYTGAIVPEASSEYGGRGWG